MQLFALEGNRQMLDGGAMFGHAPKALWSRWVTADQHNRIPMACRCLLWITDDGQKILFETGIGNFFPPAMKARYGVIEDNHCLVDNLARLGLVPDDIDFVILSHLHFDHAGGLLSGWQADQPPRLLFSRARYVTGKQHFDHALAPHLRDQASFLPELNRLLVASGRLLLVDEQAASPIDGLRFHFSQGHTPGMLLSEIDTAAGPLLFAADLIPGAAWMHLPITMGYDRCAERLVDEKAVLLQGLLARGGRLFFTHDDQLACARVACDDRQRFYAQAAPLM